MPTTLRLAACFAAAVSLSSAATAQTLPPAKHAAAARIADGAIVLDGRLNEPAWSEATALADFVQKEPTEGAAPTEGMEIRFVYDGSALYVGARMLKKPGSPVQAPLGRRDRFEQTEHILVALDTFHDRRTAYVFGVTASGVRLDRYHPGDNETTIDEGFNPVWNARTRIDEDGWTAELWIPFSQLRFTSAPEQIWGLNVKRSTPTLNEDDYWAPVPRTVTAWSSRFGELRGIHHVSSRRGAELLPYLAETSAVRGTQATANPFSRGTDMLARVGADLKMGVGPNLTIDATINPDFGQVEADPAEVNLTGVETFFDERRPFFTEGASLLNLSAVGNFFYSRRIGAPPTGPAAADFVDRPTASTILGAAKLTGRTTSGMSLGALTAVTAPEEARAFVVATGQTTRVPVGPTAFQNVLRVQQEFGRNKSTFSGMTTFVQRNLDSTSLLANSLMRRAVTASGDTTLRFRNGDYVVTGYAGVSRVEGTPTAIAAVQRAAAHFGQRPDRTYSRYDPTLTALNGFKGGGSVQRQGGRHWIWTLQHDNESPNLELNDLGRLGAADGLQAVGDLRYRETVPGRIFRNYWVGAHVNQEWTYGRERVANSTQIYANQTWRNFWNTQSSITLSPERLDARLTRGGPLMTVPGGWSAMALLKNRPSAQTSWSVQVDASGNDDGGSMRQIKGAVALRPGPRWQVSLTPTLLTQLDTQQYVTQLAGGARTFGRRYVFGSLDRTTISTQVRMTYTLKPDMTLDVYAEPFAATGRYTNVGELSAAATRGRVVYGQSGTSVVTQADGNLRVTDGTASFQVPAADFHVRSFRSNLVLRWEYRPGSTLYLVWQEDRRGSYLIGPGGSAVSGVGRSFLEPGTHYFVVKTSFWLPVR